MSRSRARWWISGLILLACSSVHAATRTFTGPGNFSDSGRWDNNLTNPTPIAGDDLIIINSCTFDDAALAADYGSLTLNSAATVTWTGTISGQTLSVTSVSSSGGSINMTGGGTLKLRGAGAVLPTSNFTLIQGSGTVIYAGSGQTIAPITHHNIIVSGSVTNASGTTPLDGYFAVPVGGSFSPGAGTIKFTAPATLSNDGTLVFKDLEIAANYVTTSSSFDVAGTMTLDAGGAFSPTQAVVINNAAPAGTLNGSGTVYVTGARLTDQYKFAMYSLVGATSATSLTVWYSGSALLQTIDNLTYGNLTVSGGPTATLAGPTTVTYTATAYAGTFSAGSSSNTLTVGGDFDVVAGATFDTAGGTHTVSGTLSVSGTVSGSGTVVLNGATPELSGSGSFASTATLEFATDITLHFAQIPTLGNVAIDAGHTVINNASVTIAGNLSRIGGTAAAWTNNGSLSVQGTIAGAALGMNFNASAAGNTVDYTGGDAQPIYVTTYYNLTVCGTSGPITKTVGSGTAVLNQLNAVTAGTVNLPAMNIGGNLFVAAGTTVNAGGSLTIGGNFTVDHQIPAVAAASWCGSGQPTAVAAAAMIGDGSANFGIDGIFNAGSFTHHIGGSFSVLGVFNADTSTIDFNGASPASIGAATFYNLTITGNTTKSASGNLIVGRDFTVGSSSTFNPASYTHTINGNTTLTGTMLSGTSTFAFNGGTPQTLSNTSSSTFYNLTLNNSLGLTVTGVLPIANTLTLGTGTLTASPYVTIGPAGSIVQSTGWVTGQLQKAFTSAGSFTFAVGTTAYRPITFNVTSGAPTLTVQVFDVAQPNASGPNVLPRYWHVVQSGAATGDMAFDYNASDVTGTESSYVAARFGTYWTRYPGSINSTTHHASQTGLSSLGGDWTAGETQSLLTACAAPPSGVVSWYRAEGNANDSIGPNNGSFVGTVPTTGGKVGQAFSLAGGGQYISIPDNASIHTSSVSVEAWVNFASTAGLQMLVSKPYGGGTGNSYQLYFSGYLTAEVGNSTGNSGIQFPWTPTVGVWYHVAFTFDGGSNMSALYINGAQVASGSLPKAIAYDSNPLLIGAEFDPSPSYFFNGLIDEVTIYNRALTSSEIASVYNSDTTGKCYTAPAAPTITLTNPSFGTAGTSVTITGTGLDSVSSATFGGTAATITSQSATSMVVTAPSHALGLVSVTVTNPGGSATLTTGFHYTSTSCDPAPSGIVGWWRAEGNANDGIGPNNGSIVGGALTTAGKVGQAFPFNGTSQYVTVPDNASLHSSAHTLEAWVNFSSMPSSFACIICKPLGTAQANSYSLFYSGGQLMGQALAAVWSPSIGTWHHVAYTNNGSVDALFIDGVQVAGGASPVLTFDSNPLLIGADKDNGSYTGFFPGSIDEPTIYNRALSAAEVSAIYDADSLGKCYTAPAAPTITLINPASGAAGTSVTITGTGLDSVSSATFGGTAATITSQSATSMVVTAPSHALGLVDVTVTNPGGSATLTNGFHYTTASCAPAPSGIVSWYRAENTAIDGIGPNNLTLNGGATFAAGKVGQAFTFNGSTAYASAADTPSLRPSSLTVEAWVNWSAPPSGTQTMVAKAYGSGVADSYVIWSNGGTLKSTVCNSGGCVEMSGAWSPVVGTWYHVAMTYDSATQTQALYLNGNLVASGASLGVIAYDTHALTIGADISNNAVTEYFPGLIDEVTLYNRALSASEISSIYNAASGDKCYTAPTAPSITGLVPSSGLIGQSVTINGSNLDSVGTVTFGSSNAPITSWSPSALTVTAPPNVAGAVTVTATNAGGSATSAYTYTSACEAAPSNIVAWYRAENNANDGIGPNNAQLIGGATFTAGKVGQAFSFSGSGTYVRAADHQTLRPTSLTLEAWVKWTALPSGTQTMIAKPFGSGASDSYVLWSSGGTLMSTTCNSAGCVQFSAPWSPVVGTWYHVAMTYNNATQTQALYLNGALMATGASVGVIEYDTHPLTIGADISSGAATEFFPGAIDEVTLYDRALTASEISAIYFADFGGKCYTAPPAPVITGLIPSSGGISQAVTINGSNLANVNTVTFGSATALITSWAPTSLTVMSPANNAGTVTVTAINPGGSGTSSYTYSSACAAAPSGMLAAYRAEGAGNDAVGTNHASLIGGVGFTTGKVGQAFSFNGTSAYASAPDNASLRPTSVTVEAWVKWSASPSGTQTMVAKALGSGVNDSYVIWSSGGTLMSSICNAGGCGQISAPWSPIVGSWYHVAMTYDNASRIHSLYLNGSLMTSAASIAVIDYDTQPLTIGADISGNVAAEFFPGLIDEVAIYSRALSASEIFSIYFADFGGKCFGVTLPSVASVRPTSGNVNGGATIHLAGSNLAGATSVTVGGTAASIISASSNEVLASLPAHAAGLVDVRVTTADGSATCTGCFTYDSTWDFARDFSQTTNPAGAWTYGQSPTRGGTFTAYNTHAYDGVLDYWYGGAILTPLVTHNGSATAVTNGTTTTVTIGSMKVYAHPGGSGENSVVRWSATTTGSYHITGGFTGLDSAGTTSDAAVLHGATTLFSTNADNSLHAFALDVLVNAGETIDFTVGYGSNNNASSDSTQVDATITLVPGGIADLSIAKTASAASVFAGRSLTYTLQVSNAGPSSASSVSVTDALPAGFTLNSASGAGWTCSGTTTITCTMPALAIGSAAPITISVTAPSSAMTGAVNTATVASSTSDSNATNNSASASVDVIVAPSSLSVGSNADSGPGTLRQAILDANSGACASPCTFTFNLSPTTQISLLSALPSITASNIIFDGTTQPGYTTTPLVVLDGTSVTGGDGLALMGSSITVKALTIQNFPGRGIELLGSGETILNNIIQSNRGGALALGSNPHVVSGNTIRNNTGGIAINSLFGTFGKYIAAATVVSGTSTVSNNSITNNTGDGISITGVNGVTISGNTISNNTGSGISVASNSANNQFFGNSIFTNGVLGIDLNANGLADANDTGDADTGGNNLQNTPVLLDAQIASGTLFTHFNLDSSAVVPTASIKVELFKGDTSSAIEGKRSVGTQCFVGNSLTNAALNVSATGLAVGDSIVATATSFTDSACTTVGDGTSEFSAGVVATACTPPAVTITTRTPTICAGGSATLDAGSGFASYLWSTGATTQSITVTPGSTTTYTVQVTDARGCPNSASQTITVNPLPNATITGPTSTCAGSSVTLTANGGTSFSWSTGATTPSITVTPTATTTYSVTVTDSNGCSASASQTVTVGTTPTATITPSGPTTFCSGGSVTLTASAGTSYLWSTGATTQSITVTTSGNSTVTVGSGSCSATSSPTVVTVNPAPTATITGPTSTCSGTSVTLTANGGTSFSWSTGATTQSITVSPTSTTTYSVTVTDRNGCSASASQTVNVGAAPTITPSGPTTFCSGGSVTLTASSGTSYLWSTGATTQSINVTTSGSYTVTVAGGSCSSATSAPMVVTVNPTPNATITAPSSVNAGSAGNVASVTPGAAGTTYAWLISPGGTITSATNTSSITFAAPLTGSVTLKVTVTNGGCTASSNVTIPVASTDADLSIAMNALPEPVLINGTLNYGITVTNNGPAAAPNVTVTDTLPAGVTFSGATGQFNCSQSATLASTITCSLPFVLAAKSSASMTITVTAPATSGSITNTVQVSAAASDPDSTNNTATFTSHVNLPPRNCPTGVAIPKTPGKDASDVANPVTFEWFGVPDAVRYTVRGTIDGGAEQTFGETDATSATISVTLKGSHVTWFVRTHFKDETCFTDSAPLSFTLEEPDTCDRHTAVLLSGPGDNTTLSSSSVLFEWQPSRHANEYRVWAKIGAADFAALGPATADTKLSAVMPFGSIEWYVEALFPGCASVASEHRHFTIPQSNNCASNAPAVLDCASCGPANNSTVHNQSIEFHWQAPANATNVVGYEVYISLNSGSFTLLGPPTKPDTTTLRHDVAAGNLEWFVRTLYSGCDGVDSAHFTFVFDPPPVCPTGRPLLAEPGEGEHVVSPKVLRWSSVPGVNNYVVTYKVNHGEPKTIPVTNKTETDAIPLSNGVVEWTVETSTANCPAIASTPGSFVVVPRPPKCETPDAPSIRAEANASTDVEFTVRWSSSSNVTFYELEESAASNFAGATPLRVEDTQKKFKHNAAGTYFYRVRAVNNCNDSRSDYSDIAIVTIVPPQPQNPHSAKGATPADNPQPTTYQLKICTIEADGCSFIGTLGQTFIATTDQPWLTVSPSSGTIGVNGVTLTVTATTTGLNVGSNTGSVSVSFSSQAAAQGRLLPHGGTTTATTNISVTLGAPVANQPKNTPPPDALIIPAVAHADGLSSHFESDIRVSNTSPQPMKYQLTFTPSGDSGIKEGKQTTLDIDPGKTVALDDVLQTWFGAGSQAKSATGALEIRPLTTTSSSVSSTAQTGLPNIVTFASSRTYSTLTQGTYGTFIPAVPFANFIGKSSAALSLQQVAQTPSFRTNLGLVEGSGEPATVLIKMFNASGQQIGSMTQQLNGGQHLQINQVLATKGLTNVADGRMEISVASATGKVTAYASVLDNNTNDAQLVSPVSLSAAGSAKYVLAGVADTNDENGKTQTDVRLFNPTNAEVKATLALHVDGSSDVVTKDVTIGAGQVQTLDNVMQTVFGKSGVGAAALHITTAAPVPLVATAKTYTQLTSASIGQFINAVTPQQAITANSRPLQLLQVEESNRFSTDVGVAELSGKPVNLEISIIPQDSKVSAKVQVSLAGGEFKTFRQIINAAGLQGAYNARVTVKVIGGAGAATAYASTTDLVTKDHTFLPAQ